MSKIKIQGSATGTGILTIQAPTTSTDRTMTIPDSDGTILNSGSTLDATKLSGDLPAISGASLTGIDALPSGGTTDQVLTKTVSGEAWADAAAGGKMVSFNYDEDSTVYSTTSSSPQSVSNLSVTVTPQNSSNLLMIHCCMAAETYGTFQDKGIRFNIYRDGTLVYESDYDIYTSVDGGTQNIGKVNLSKVLTAGSTTSTTFTIKYCSTASHANGSARVNQYGSPSSLQVTEMSI